MDDKFFKGWFVFVAMLSVLMLLGLGGVVIYLLPHIVGLIDQAR